ncbi:MAG: response regulator [Desulfamplus sp.]|nr:response regulator [Desulfamplus sp.]MBF0243003.1 response regulator [Desulfamplus sp.]MBF0390373.1 response regulator [Desulfamplus sp.]
MSKTIMIVDDARSMRGLLAITLQGAGYTVVDACDGQDAMEKIAGQKVHLIITDLNMPNMNGIELIKNLKANPEYKFLPMVMLTTESEESKKKEGQMAGAKAWIVKPFKPETVLNVVQKIIG